MPLQMIIENSNIPNHEATVIPIGEEYIPWRQAGTAEIAFDTPQRQTKLVFRTSVPTWHGGRSGEEETLRRCYRLLFKLTVQNKCSSLAVPVLGTAPGAFPKV